MVFASVECITNCGKCGQPVMINGPVLRVLCHACQSELEIDHVTWKSVMGQISKIVSGLKEGAYCQMKIMAGQDFQVTITRTGPACPSCKTAFQAPDDADQKGRQAWRCLSCGGDIPVSVPPKWLEHMAPEICLLVNAQEDAPDGKPEPPAGKPIIFACPSCGGNLNVDGTNRLITCTFCQSSIYLPDDLWLRLHPAKMVRAWSIGLHDKDGEPDRLEANRELLDAATSDDANSGAEALARGADPDCTDDNGRTPLYLAAAVDCRDLVRRLIEKKADLDRPDEDGTTPINIAAYNGNLMVVQYLLKEGVDVNRQNNVGVTAIYGAARNGHEKVVRLLLKSGADPSIPNEDGVTPEEKAAQEGHAAVAALLREHRG